MRKRLLVFLFAGALLLTLLALGAGQAAQSQGALTPIRATFGPLVIGSPVATWTPAPPTATPTLPATPTPAELVSPTPVLPTLNRSLMGIQAYAYMEVANWWPMVDRMQFMGFGWIKAQVNWKEHEPEPGVFDAPFTVLRDNLVYAGRRGFKIMISVVNAPDWARPADARGNLDGPPEDPQALANFVGALLDNWGTEYVNAIEIWNEANLLREWTGRPRSGAEYKRYFDAAYAAIRARSSDIVVVTAGPAPAGDTPDGSVNDRTWLRQLYATGLPVGDPHFAIGIHPYGWANPPDAHCCAAPSQGWDDQRFFFFLDNIADYRQIMLENGHEGGRLWATEFGWATFQGLRYQDHVAGPPAIPPADPGQGWMNRLTEQQQAEYVVRAFELAQTGDLAAFMGPMILWNLNFSSLEDYVPENEPSRSEAGFSVLNSDWATRPIYDLLQSAPKVN